MQLNKQNRSKLEYEHMLQNLKIQIALAKSKKKSKIIQDFLGRPKTLVEFKQQTHVNLKGDLITKQMENKLADAKKNL